MKKTTTAILLSALVIPGAGHLYLKKNLTGSLLITVTIVALYVLVSTAIEKAILITDKILNGEVQSNLSTISELVTSQLSSTDTTSVNLAKTVFVIVWLIGVADSYRIGKKLERTNTDIR